MGHVRILVYLKEIKILQLRSLWMFIEEIIAEARWEMLDSIIQHLFFVGASSASSA